MPAWAWVLGGVGLFCLGSLAMVWACLRAAAQHDKRIPVDDTVDVVADPELDRPDCACEDCWSVRMDELVDAYDWTAAEQQMPRKLRRQS